MAQWIVNVIIFSLGIFVGVVGLSGILYFWIMKGETEDE